MPSWAGLWDNMHAQPYALLNEPNSTLRTIARAMAPQGVRHWGRLADMLTGSTIPSLAQETIAQVKPQQADGLNMGGLVPVQQTVVINRNTTAADESILDKQFTPSWAPNPYPVDKSGNGGGSKAGTIN
jgi:hypothetical protein